MRYRNEAADLAAIVTRIVGHLLLDPCHSSTSHQTKGIQVHILCLTTQFEAAYRSRTCNRRWQSGIRCTPGNGCRSSGGTKVIANSNLFKIVTDMRLENLSTHTGQGICPTKINFAG